jgi:hypothetical protein
MTKAQEMARRYRQGDSDWWFDSMEQAQVYLVFDDGSVFSEWDREPCRFEMQDGRVHAVVFEDESTAQPEDMMPERRRKELALARLLDIAVELIRKTGDTDLDIRIENAEDMIREFKLTYPEASEI